jgi:glycine/D-amino acid oxidase-like deaminating enzyme
VGSVKRIIVVGGGIAGLSAAWHLARSGADHRVQLLERESLLCTHASGRNAAIFRPLEADATLASLARRSLELFQELSPERPLVEPTGLMLLARAPETLAPIARTARTVGTPCTLEAPTRVSERLAGLCTEGWHGLYGATGGVLDIHALTEGLGRVSRALGVEVRSNTGVLRVITKGTRVVGVETSQQEVLEADVVVLAAGAWNVELGTSTGVALPFSPIRRHLALLAPEQALPTGMPAVWSLDDEVYFRREGARVLTSPCDETAWTAGVPQAELQCLEGLAGKLAGIDAGLGRAQVVRYWACLRTFVPDRRPVIGADPRMRGIYWLGGLGGFGMTTAVAAGEVLAHAVTGREPPPAVAPQRLLGPRGA